MTKNLYVASPLGFCAGVVNAIDSLNDLISLTKEKEKIYGFHEIVHNNFITNEFIKKGVIFTNEIAHIPDESYVVFSAHGVGKNVFNLALKKKLKIVDLTCPLVSKVHRQVLKFCEQKCEKIIYIGDPEHQESKGTLNRIVEAGLSFEAVYDVCDIKNLNLESLKEKKLAYLSQTTLNVSKVLEIIDELKKIFPEILGGNLSDICHATKNRQMALKKIIDESIELNEKIDFLVVIGSETSSNSKKLVEVGKSFEIESYLIDDLPQISRDIKNLNNAKNIILTAGASAPKILIERILEYFIKEFNFNMKIVKYIDEDVVFHAPKILRDLKKMNK